MTGQRIAASPRGECGTQASLPGPTRLQLLSREHGQGRPGRLRDVSGALQTAPPLAQLGDARAVREGEAGGAHAQVSGRALGARGRGGTRARGGALRRAAGTSLRVLSI